MKILYITTSYEQKNSSAAIRNNALVNGFIDLGHDVVVLTPKWPCFFESEFLKRQNKAKVIHSKIPDLELLKFTSRGTSRKKNKILMKVRRFIRDLVYFPDMCKKWKNLISFEEIGSDYDMIISSSDLKSSHYVAQRIKKSLSNVKWIQIWGDPWGDDVTLSSLIRPIAKIAERKLIISADNIVYISELTKQKIASLYPTEAKKISFIPRSYFCEVRHGKADKNTISIIYPGELSWGRSINAFIESIEEFNKRRDKKICVKLYGNYTSDIYSELSKYEFVHINSSVEFEKILELFTSEDILLFISNGSKSTQIPGKLFDYLGTELPVICLVNSYSDKITEVLRSFKRCILVENNKYEIFKLLETIDKIASQRFAYDEDYSPSTIAKNIIKLLE